MKSFFHKKLFYNILISILLFTTTYFSYRFLYPNPRTWYQHYLYQAKSFIQLRVDIPDLPDFYQDRVIKDGKILTPFPPIPAVVLVPFVLVSKNITQQEVSFVIGAINSILAYYLFKKYSSKHPFVLTLFFVFGTVAFWSAIVGTTWYFAHTLALAFMLLSLILHKDEKHYWSGLFFALAALCRYPMLMGGVFFLLELYKEPKKLIKFIIGAFPFVPIQLGYNFLRFGNIFDTGYVDVYKQYISSGYPFTIRQLWNPGASYFGYMDLRNIPLHLYNFLFMPPTVSSSFFIEPSPYGMGILFTTPLLILALFPNLKDKLQRNLFIGASFIAFTDFLHYMQGWVQFGYRFMMDFLPFLLLILAIKFRPNKKYSALLILSIIVNIWGAIWGIKLGW